MYWLVYVLMAVFALMVISMFVITFIDIAESRRTQKMYEKIVHLFARQQRHIETFRKKINKEHKE